MTIERIVKNGLGLARAADGVVIMTPGVLPGEVVRIAVARQRGPSELLEVLEPSPDRVSLPRGASPDTCDLGFASYPAQLAIKREIVRDALSHMGRMAADVEETTPSPEQWEYRTAAQYLLTDHGPAYRARGGAAGRAIRADPLTTPLIADGLSFLNARTLFPATEVALRASLESGEVLAALIGPPPAQDYRDAVQALRDAGVSGVAYAAWDPTGRFRSEVRHLSGRKDTLERFGQVSLTVTATGFAQVNPPAAGLLYERAAELAGSGAEALDLYGGSGGIAFHLAKNFERVTVLEINSQAVERGEADAKRLGLGNVSFVRGDAARLAGLKPLVVTVDPPRVGLMPEALQALIASPAARVVAISCDPATWARDVAALVAAGFRLLRVEPFDLYPQTSHVEVLSLLER